ncbi:carbohydrate ABC transporter permease [Saliphagus sp. GCM10025308]
MSRLTGRGGQQDLSGILWSVARVLVVVALFVVALVPALFALSMSVRSAANFYNPIWIPEDPTFEWYRQSWQSTAPLLENSYLRALGSTILTLLITLPASYAFARRDFAHKSLLFYAVVGVLLFPVIIAAIPITVTFIDIGLSDNIVGLWLIDLVFLVPFTVFLMRDYLSALPANIEEAAQVYGCTPFTAFVRVILPLSVPGILAVSFFAFVISWNEFFFGLLLTVDSAKPAIASLNEAVSADASLQQGVVMARTVLISLPPALMYLFARKSLTQTFQ